jgi:hypothetical protein
MTHRPTCRERRVATSDGSKKIEPGAAEQPARRAQTAAEQRAQRASGSDDPEVLAGEIERTREELAETLDAIADRVSPKRVKERTKQKVTGTVKDKTGAAKEQLHAGAASAKEKAEHAKEQAQEQVEHAKEQAQEQVEHAKEQAKEHAPGDRSGSPPAVGGVGGVPTYGAPPVVPREVLAGAAAALAVVLLLLGRRKRKHDQGWKRGAKR